MTTDDMILKIGFDADEAIVGMNAAAERLARVSASDIRLECLKHALNYTFNKTSMDHTGAVQIAADFADFVLNGTKSA